MAESQRVLYNSFFTKEELRRMQKEKNTLSCDNLVLEITRRCNMCCSHCLRGDAQSIDMDPRAILRSINMMESIGSVTFTGGEPSLRIDLIGLAYYALLDKFGRGNLPPFFVATNGRNNQFRLATVLLQWYQDCAEKEFCAVCRSEDIFHVIPEKNSMIDYLIGLKFFSEQKSHDLSEMEDECDWLISEGRGALLPVAPGVKRHVVNPATGFSVNGTHIEDTLYVSALGECLAVCDCSYENIAKHHLCKLDSLIQYVSSLGEEVRN